jgi:hypothetical protein
MLKTLSPLEDLLLALVVLPRMTFLMGREAQQQCGLVLYTGAPQENKKKTGLNPGLIRILESSSILDSQKGCI